MVSIRCGHCGGDHASVALVRACHDGGLATARPTMPDADQPTLFDDRRFGGDRPELDPGPAPVARAGSRRPSAAAVPSAGRVAAVPSSPMSWDVAAGPDALGRWLVIGVGDDVASAWTGAPRRRIDAAVVADPDDTLAWLRAHWQTRQRVVVELADDAVRVIGGDQLTIVDEAVEARPPWELDPSFTFAADELAHLLWANSVDGRDPSTPVWAWRNVALRLGAGPGGDGGDIVLADGRVAWCDGGPLTAPPGDLTIVHRVALEHGRLTVLGRGPVGTTAAELAPDQLAAVGHDGGAARIIAPAGSGKTRVLTERARHLLRVWHVPSAALTLVAFNVRAAAEMRDRTTDLDGLQVRTLNALALAIVNGSGRFSSRSVKAATIDERDVRRIIDNLVDLPRRANADPTAVWIEALAAVRLGLRDPSEVESSFGGEVPGFAEMFPRFRAALAERNALDFDEQITAAIVVLLTEPATRAVAQRSCRVLLVDEFQDLAPAHLLLLRLLASPELAVFGVGDDDQTIYGYAGATPEWLIGFGGLFPGAVHHPLEVNYRCPPAIVRAASTLLSHNRRRVAKEIRPAPDREDEPGAMRVVIADDQVTATVAAVRTHVDGGAEPSSIAVLTRVVASLAPIQVALRHHGVPTGAAVGPGYLERSGVRVALAWMRLALSPDKLLGRDVEQAARRPGRGLSPRVVEWMAGCRTRAALGALAGRLSNERDADKVNGFVADLDVLARRASAGAPTAELLIVVRDRVGLDEAMAKLDRSRADAQSTHVDDLDALVGLAGLHTDPSTFATWLHDELGAPGDPNGVMLASIHRVKGREWPHVVLHDVRDGVLPHRLAVDREEERRILHVGLTRASSSVTVVTDTNRVSPFIGQLATPRVDGDRGDSAGFARGARGGGGGAGRGGRDGVVTPARTASASRPPSTVAADDPLRVALRAWRVERAKQDAVPAYVVCTNVTLDAIVDVRPTTLDELRRIPGIGPAKRERYGPAIIDIVVNI